MGVGVKAVAKRHRCYTGGRWYARRQAAAAGRGGGCGGEASVRAGRRE